MHKYCTINSIISQEKNANYLKTEITTKSVKKVSNIIIEKKNYAILIMILIVERVQLVERGVWFRGKNKMNNREKIKIGKDE